MEAEKLTGFVVKATADCMEKYYKKQRDMMDNLILKELKLYGINALNIGEYTSTGRLTLIKHKDEGCSSTVYTHFYLDKEEIFVIKETYKMTVKYGKYGVKYRIGVVSRKGEGAK